MSMIETNNQVIFLSTTWALFGLTALLCSARFYTRFIVIRSPGADDYLMLITMALSTGMMVGLTVQTRFSLGRHVWNVTADDYAQTMKAYYAAIFCFVTSMALAKIAILLQFIKIFRSFKAFFWVCWGMIIVIVLWATLTILATTSICTTYSYALWQSQAFASQCQATVWTIHGVVSIVTDWLLVTMPIPIIWQMKLLQKQKTMICVLFAVGSAGSIVSIVRITSIRAPVDTTDPSHDSVWPFLWFTTECLIAVMCGALMACKPLVVLWFPSLSPHTDDMPALVQLDHHRPKHRQAKQREDESKQGIWLVIVDVEEQLSYGRCGCLGRQKKVNEETKVPLQEESNANFLEV